MQPRPQTPITEREQHLVDLVRRLLRLYNQSRAESEYLRGLLSQLLTEHQEVCQSYEAEIITADILLGAAVDEALKARRP